MTHFALIYDVVEGFIERGVGRSQHSLERLLARLLCVEADGVEWAAGVQEAPCRQPIAFGFGHPGPRMRTSIVHRASGLHEARS